MSVSLEDIRRTILNLQAEGRSISELEGLLVHSDDLLELLKSIPEYRNGMSNGGIKLFGVKIIESQYAQKGTIFRIFKTDDKLYPPGMINGTKRSGYYVGDDLGEQCDIQNQSGSGGICVPDDMKPPTIVEEKNGKKKRKHSRVRKVELD